jgi:hypothetical protein
VRWPLPPGGSARIRKAPQPGQVVVQPDPGNHSAVRPKYPPRGVEKGQYQVDVLGADMAGSTPAGATVAFSEEFVACQFAQSQSTTDSMA